MTPFQKYLLTFLFFISLHLHSHAQNAGIGTTSPDASALLEVSSLTKGVLIPRMTTTWISNIPSPAKGLMVYDTTKNELMVNMGTPGTPDWKTIASNSSWNVKGNAGTQPESDFVGTTDNTPLRFRIQNKIAGKIDSLGECTFLGYRAGDIAYGLSNTGIGFKSLLSNYAGAWNTAVGAHTLIANSSGASNTAVGAVALYLNTTGSYNSAFGREALLANSTGNHNVAVGYQANLYNSTGSSNTSAGAWALHLNTTGGSNAVLGTSAMYANATGHNNTAIGVDALRNTTTSSYNTAIGRGAGESNNLGWNNTLIGAQCYVSTNGLFNGVALGNAATVTANSQARIGNSSTSSIGGFANWTNISDGRYKKDVRENVKGLDFILKLRPVTYHLDVTNLRIQLKEPTENLKESGMETAIAEKESQVQTGFIAQEVEQAASELGYDFSGIDKPKNENDLYGLRYAEFVVPLVKAVQEQQLVIEDLKKQNEDLLTRLDKLESALASRK